MGSAVLSDLSGWLSILCWLGAQFPQVLENARRQSCDGLALPFLANWLLGDITNLIGCILTHQLPFQTWLAAYFVSVDFTLFAQYFYYAATPPLSLRSTSARNANKDAESSPLLDSVREDDRQVIAYERLRRLSSDRAQHYRALSDAAAHVAVTAARAASAEAARPSSVHQQRRSMDDLLYEDGLDGGEEEETPSTMMDSFYSEGGYGRHALTPIYNPIITHNQQHSRQNRRKTVSWGRDISAKASRGRGGSTSRTRTIGKGERNSTLSPLTNIDSSPDVHTQQDPMTSSSVSNLNIHMRGRPLQRQVELIDSPIEDTTLNNTLHIPFPSENNGTIPAETSTMQRASRQLSKRRTNTMRGAGLVFLSVWAFWSFGGSGSVELGNRGVSASLIPARGVVLSRYPRSLASLSSSSNRMDGQDTNTTLDFLSISNMHLTTSSISRTQLTQDDNPHDRSGHNTERTIGRISAWICTTLYLTSRLPQIWKNYTRKSVSGLSIALFVCAFLGNTFYVLSILTSPNLDLPRHQAVAFLRESVPYLLGSGGTLLFDVTIVVQSFIYKDNPPVTAPSYHRQPLQRSLSHIHHSLSPSQPHRQSTYSNAQPPINRSNTRTSASDPLSQSMSSSNTETDRGMRMRRSRSRTLSSTVSDSYDEVPPTSEHEHSSHSVSPARSRWKQGAIPV